MQNVFELKQSEFARRDANRLTQESISMVCVSKYFSHLNTFLFAFQTQRDNISDDNNNANDTAVSLSSSLSFKRMERAMSAFCIACRDCSWVCVSSLCFRMSSPCRILRL